MTDHSMLFSAPMVCALLAGRKTQTRRVLSLLGHRKFSEFGRSDTPGYDWHFRRADGCWCDFRHDEAPFRYKVGDRIWVREAWRTSKVADDLKPGQMVGGDYTPVWYECHRDNCDAHGRYRHARHMPKWASRLTLTVTDVRVERLQDISEADAIAEGWQAGLVFPIDWYRSLWDSINGVGSWGSNPWVSAISFEVVTGNINGL